MQLIKYIGLALILGACSYIGYLISKKYANREKELKEMKSALNIFITKIKYTYEPIPKIFEEISQKIKDNRNVSNIFKVASRNMAECEAGEAWNRSLENVNTNMKSEDINVLKGLSKLLGKVDADGQVREIELVDNFLNKQIEDAEKERAKNERMYRTLGISIGIAITVILI